MIKLTTMKDNFNILMYLKKDKKAKLFLGFIVFFLVLYLLLLPVPSTFEFLLFSQLLSVGIIKTYIIVVFLLSIGLSFMRLLYIYLENNAYQTNNSSLENILKVIDNYNIDDKVLITKHILENSKIDKNNQSDIYNKLLRDFFSIQNRLEQEIKSLNKKANMNLIIGITTTAISIVYLIVFSFNIPHIKEVIEFFASYLPRLTLLVFIELFSFYFLNLYKHNLNQIKYYQDENTDINFKIISLKVALLNNKPELLDKVLTNFLEMQHNKIVTKEQTTLEFEKYKLEAEMNKNLYEKLLSLLNIENLKK